MFLEPKGRNWGTIVNWDDLGKAYAVLIVTWTAILLSGITWLILNRRQPYVRFRNLPLAIASTSFLHIYLIKICLAYTTNGHFLCSAEFWIMSIYLPFGIALFQASLVQLRSTWEQQQRLVSASSNTCGDESETKSLLQKWRSLSTLRRSYCVIGCGMLVQLVITIVLYVTTPTLQGDWSSFGKVSHAKGQALCRKSLAWIPSAFWQLFWSWCYGPYTLFSVRNIHDIHFWRAQVIVSIVSGLPGTPMWLAALYTPEFLPVNRRFVPPMWLAPGIMVMQFVTIFFPIFEGWQSNHQMRQTLSILDAWEKHNSGTSSDQSSLIKATPKTSVSSMSSRPTTSPDAETRINTMAALRAALTLNPKPLLEFAATKDFSAENILFLTEINRWRSNWNLHKSCREAPMVSLDRLFGMGLDIYVNLVSCRTAEFPINVGSKIATRLDAVFESAASESGRAQYSSTMFDQAAPAQIQFPQMTVTHTEKRISEERLWDKRATVVSIEPVSRSHPSSELRNRVESLAELGFDEHTFDEAEKSIEYLVLTNTWQKFVKHKAAKRVEDVL